MTTVATRGATSGALLPTPCTTSSRRRAASHGIAAHCAASVLAKFHGGPCVTVTGNSHPIDPSGPRCRAHVGSELARDESGQLDLRLDFAHGVHELTRVAAEPAGARDEVEQVETDAQRSGGHEGGEGSTFVAHGVTRPSRPRALAARCTRPSAI